MSLLSRPLSSGVTVEMEIMINRLVRLEWWKRCTIALVFLLSACSAPPMQPQETAPIGQMTPDSRLVSFYHSNGGQEVLGAIISEAYEADSLICQDTEKARLCFNPNGNGFNRYTLTWTSSVQHFSTPYAEVLNRMGGEAVFGQPLGEPRITVDGSMEQLYTTVLVYSPADSPSLAHFRQLAITMNMPASAPGPSIYDKSDGMIFRPVQGGDLGYHVPLVFDEFIAQHGGIEQSGEPISEPMRFERDGRLLARQCFQNYCLEYDAEAAPGQQTRLASLGLEYSKTIPANPIDPVDAPEVDNSLCVQVSEDKAQVASNEAQTLYMLVYKRHTMEPVPNVTATVTLTLPDGRELVYYAPPTGANGWVSIQIPPIDGVDNGSIVMYRVCLDQMASDPECFSETYLIWNHR